MWAKWFYRSFICCWENHLYQFHFNAFNNWQTPTTSANRINKNTSKKKSLTKPLTIRFYPLAIQKNIHFLIKENKIYVETYYTFFLQNLSDVTFFYLAKVLKFLRKIFFVIFLDYWNIPRLQRTSINDVCCSGDLRWMFWWAAAESGLQV